MTQPVPAQPLEYSPRGDAPIFRETHTRARWAGRLAAVYIPLGLLMQVGSYFQQLYVADVMRELQRQTQTNAGGGGAFPFDATFLIVSAVSGLVGIAVFGLFVAMLVMYGMWQYRAAHNCAAIGEPVAYGGPGLGVGWWFIPLANLVMPLLVMRDLWRKSLPRDETVAGGVGVPTRAFLLLLGGLLVSFGSGIYLQVKTFSRLFEQAQAAGQTAFAGVERGDLTDPIYLALLVTGNLLWIGGLLAMIPFVKGVRARQEQARREAEVEPALP